MILAKIKWIFFDIGSTLVDESVAYRNRIERTIAGTNVTYDDFDNVEKLIGFILSGTR